MIQANKITGIIDDYLEKCYTEPITNIYATIENLYADIIDVYGWKTVTNVLEACSLQMCSDKQEQYYKAVKNIKKETIFEITSKLSFLAGMAYIEMENESKKYKEVF